MVIHRPEALQIILARETRASAVVLHRNLLLEKKLLQRRKANGDYVKTISHSGSLNQDKAKVIEADFVMMEKGGSFDFIRRLSRRFNFGNETKNVRFSFSSNQKIHKLSVYKDSRKIFESGKDRTLITRNFKNGRGGNYDIEQVNTTLFIDNDLSDDDLYEYDILGDRVFKSGVIGEVNAVPAIITTITVRRRVRRMNVSLVHHSSWRVIR